jgi:hypothetical protein
MQVIVHGLLIFVLLLLNSVNQSDTTLFNTIMTESKEKKLEIKFNIPDKIRDGQPCEIVVEVKNISSSETIVNKRLSVGYQNSLSRELYIIICHEGLTENVGIQKVLYERSFSSHEDYVKLLPGKKISTKFNLFDWYEFPKAGNYTLQVCYQGDEKLAYKPDGLAKGILCAEKKMATFESD